MVQSACLKTGPVRSVRIGFVPLIDAAPLILAQEMGYFRDEGLEVTLCREIGWGNVRDKLAYGSLQASHALMGLPIQLYLSRVFSGVPVMTVMNLGCGGDAITLSERMAFSGVNSAATLAKFIRQSRGQIRPIFAHVFSCSVHHYLLRDWLESGGIRPDEDIRLCVLPPVQMSTQISGGYLDGFCVGEPWNTLTHRAGAGRMVALTADILPRHPDKVLAVNQKWAERESDLLVPMIRAVLRGCLYCADPNHYPEMVRVLSRPKYLNVSQEVLLASLLLDRTFGTKTTVPGFRSQDWEMRSFKETFPSVTHGAWLVNQMIRWGHLPADVDPWVSASACVTTQPYREAAASLQLTCPETDTPPMKLRNSGIFAASVKAMV